MKAGNLALALLGVIGIGCPVVAQAELSPNAKVIATGLNNPRGLAFDPQSGLLYVAEAGLGGSSNTTGLCAQAPPPLGPITGGNTGRISTIDASGRRLTLVDGLPSSKTQFSDILGPADVEFSRGKLYALVQAGCSKGNRNVPNAVFEINQGKLQLIADLSDFTIKNPQSYPPDSDQDPEGVPASFKADAQGGLLVVDANRSTVNRVGADGKVTRFVDLTRFIMGATVYDTPVAIDIDRFGNVFVGSFGYLPFAPASSTIYQVTPGAQQVFPVGWGFTTLIDMVFGPDGSLYVLETSTANTGNFPFLIRNTGRVSRLNYYGALEFIATGLDMPSAMTFGPDGALYVSNRGHGVQNAPGQGEIVRIGLGRP